MPGASNVHGQFEARYSNHFQVGHNEFEFIFDFSQLHAAADKDAGESAVQIIRIVMAPPFAHALLETLQSAIVAHEQLHGPIDEG